MTFWRHYCWIPRGPPRIQRRLWISGRSPWCRRVPKTSLVPEMYSGLREAARQQRFMRPTSARGILPRNGARYGDTSRRNDSDMRQWQQGRQRGRRRIGRRYRRYVPAGRKETAHSPVSRNRPSCWPGFTVTTGNLAAFTRTTCRPAIPYRGRPEAWAAKERGRRLVSLRPHVRR